MCKKKRIYPSNESLYLSIGIPSPAKSFEDDHVVINSQKDAAAFIKMLNDDIVRSELTGQEYDSPSKSALEPQE